MTRATKVADTLKTKLRHALVDVERYDVWAKPKKSDYHRQIEIRVSDRKTGNFVTCDRSTNSLDSDSDVEAVVADLVGELKKLNSD